MSSAPAMLSVNGIEVIYNHVILVLKGVSLTVREGGIVALLGANGAGKTTTLRAISNLLKAERGEVTKGYIEYMGERIERLTPVGPGEARRGAGDGRAALLRAPVGGGEPADRRLHAQRRRDAAAGLERVYEYFPRLKERRHSQSGYTSGGEQQMTAIGRALMARPKMILLDEPSMGLAPQLVEEIFEIVKGLNEKEKVSFLLAEQNTNIALRYADYGYILENGRVVMDGEGAVAGAERGREGVLPRLFLGRAQELPRREVLPPPQALAIVFFALCSSRRKAGCFLQGKPGGQPAVDRQSRAR